MGLKLTIAPNEIGGINRRSSESESPKLLKANFPKSVAFGEICGFEYSFILFLHLQKKRVRHSERMCQS